VARNKQGNNLEGMKRSVAFHPPPPLLETVGKQTSRSAYYKCSYMYTFKHLVQTTDALTEVKLQPLATKVLANTTRVGVILALAISCHACCHVRTMATQQ
jgi:hypothetical protein